MKYVCEVCGYVYDPAVGDPDGGIAPGTAFEDIPEDWDGEMGVPITFMYRYNPNQFEIVGKSLELADMKIIRERLGRNDGGARFYIEQDGHLNRLYDRIVIRRRRQEETV